MSATSAPQGPIFVVGCQRSGTSALWRAMGSHPRLRIPAVAPLDHEGLPIRKELWFVREFLLGRELNANNAYAGTEIDREFRRRFAQLTDEFCREHFASPSGRWLSAHPADGAHVREILEMFPDARVLYLTRHPQEVVWSSLHAPWAQHEDRQEFMEKASRAARWWRRFADLCLAAQAGELGERILVVRHERMIREPEAVVRECLALVGESYDEACTRSLGTVFNSSFLDNDVASTRVEQSRPGVGADHELCRRVVELTGDLMARLGYADLSGQCPDPAATWREHEATLTEKTRRIQQRLQLYFQTHHAQARWVYRLLGLGRQYRREKGRRAAEEGA